MKKIFSLLRKEYSSPEADDANFAKDPLEQFEKWFKEAVRYNPEMPDAMHLSTAGKDGKPSGRIVLLKGFDEKGFLFFTSYESSKGKDLEQNSYAALTFYWSKLHRQVRIEGKAERIPEDESDRYFNSRPRESRISAVASLQSRILESREKLQEEFRITEQKYTRKNIPRPSHWGGYRIVPYLIEFWQGRSHRLHDRIVYHSDSDGSWRIQRLYP